MKELKFKNVIENKISSFSLLDNRIRNCDINYDEEKRALNATLTFENFKVDIKYSYENYMRGYSFLESEFVDNCLNAKFTFNFSKIPFSIYDVHNAVDDKEFVTYDFHTINDEKSAQQAIDTIVAFISRNADTLNDCDENIKSKLLSSFENGVKLASKKLTLEKIENDPKKYLKHQSNLYSYRAGQSYFTDFVGLGKTKALQRWLPKQSINGKLLTFEERYYEYLIETDFKVENPQVKENAKKSKKLANNTFIFEAVLMIISIGLGFALNCACEPLAQKLFYKGYITIENFNYFNSYSFILLAISISFLLAPILKKLFFSKINLSPTYEKIFEEKKKTTIISLVFIVLIFVINTLAYSKCLAINDNNIYLCESIGKAKYIEYTDAKYYKIDGYYDDDNEFYEEPNIEIVINGNDEYSYEISEGDFTQEELERVIASKMEFAGEYKTYIEFSDSVLQ